jgi:hypothetical protein
VAPGPEPAAVLYRFAIHESIEMKRVIRLLAASMLAWASLPVLADTDADLARKAADPTQSPLSLQFYNYYTPSYYGVEGSGNQLVFRPVLPYRAFGVDNIIRFTFTHNTRGPGGLDGFGDVQFLQLSIVERWGGRVAFGLSGSLPTGTDAFSTEKYTVGPALGYVTGSGVVYGALAQSFFSYAGSDRARSVAQINLQPVLAIPLGGTKTFSLGNSGLLYDFERSRWASIAPSAQFAWMMEIGGLKWRPQVEVTHEFRDLPGNPRTTYRVGAQLLLPR